MTSSAKVGDGNKERAAFAGRLAGTVQILFAMLIGGVSALAGGAAPDFLPRGVVLLLIYSLPGVVGLLGVAERRPALLLAAAAASAVGSLVAFSGVTLIFLVPAVIFLVGAARLASADAVGAGMSMRSTLAGVVVAAVLVMLMVGAGASALLVTDERCWTMYETQGGGIRYEAAPVATGEVAVPEGALSYGCSNGVISARGVGLGGLLGGSALAIVIVTGRRRGGAARSISIGSAR
jgi:hypothetical protein